MSRTPACRRPLRAVTTGLLAGSLVTALAGGCALPAGTLGYTDPAQDGVLNVVATTGILADLARNVAGDRATVTQMVPDGADPHSWEPSLRSVRDVAYADLALSNYLLLEEHALIRTLDSNLPDSALSVSVAEEAARNGATVLPLVEDRSLDTVWLGMRVLGDGADGPGHASAYLVTSFGAPEVGFATSDGVGEGDDTAVLPADAHQHMSWAFTRPGVYRLTLSAVLHPDGDRPGPDAAAPVALGSATAVFAVGVSGAEVAAQEGRAVVDAGHADLTANLSAPATEAAATATADGSVDAGVVLAVDTATLPEVLTDRARDAGGLAAAMSVVGLDDVVISVQTIGNVLVLALLVTPAATARLLTDRLTTMLWLAPLIGAAGGVLGLYLSWAVDVPTGVTIVLLLTAAFALAWLAAPRHGALARLRSRRRAAASARA